MLNLNNGQHRELVYRMNMQNYPLNSRQQRKFASLSRNSLPQKLEKNVQRNKSIKNNNPGITITYHHQEVPKRIYSNYMMRDPNQKNYQPIYTSNTVENASNLIKERKSFVPKKTDWEQQFNIPRKSIQIHSNHKRQTSEMSQPVLQNKKSESEVEKLTKICQEFYHQNQKLKLRLLQNDSAHIQHLNKRITELDNQVIKSKQMIQNRNRQIAQMGGKLSIIDLSEKIQGFTRPSFSKLHTQNNADSKLDKLTQQLRSKQDQLMKYMQKESQYIQVYVQKEQLQHEIRNLVSIIESQNRQLQENKHNAGMRPREDKQCRDCDQNKQAIRKMTEFNQKLTGMLNMSSTQIQRLNNLLKIKVDVIESNRNIISQLKNQLNLQKDRNSNAIQSNEIHTFKVIEKNSIDINSRKLNQLNQLNSQLQQRIKQFSEKIQQKNKRISQFQLNIETLIRENKNLQLRLNDQVGVSFELRDFITKLQSQLKRYHQVEKKEVQINTEPEINQQTKQEVKQEEYQQKGVYLIKQKQENLKQEQQSDQRSLQVIENDDKNIVAIQLSEAETKINDYQKQLTSLKQENQDLIKFIVRQNTDIVKLKDQIQNLKLKQMLTEKSLQKLSVHEKQLPILLSRVKEAEDKLINATKTYNKLLHQVQSSQSQTESVHKQLEEMLQEKQGFLRIDNFKIAPMSTRSQTGHLIDKAMKKSSKNQSNGLDVSQAKSNYNRLDSEQQWQVPKSKDPQSTFHSQLQPNRFKNDY